MAVLPTSDVYVALRDAAVKSQVPITLLMAVAWAESSFDPKAIGSPTSEGWRAQGLMQLSPAIVAKYGVSDPFSAAQSAAAGARYIAALGSTLKWNVPKMLAAYNWGPGNVARAIREKKTYPKSVQDYIRKVTRARSYYEDAAGEPVGDTWVKQLGNAVDGLEKLNPAWKPAQDLKARWSLWLRMFGSAPLVDLSPATQDLWTDYERAFMRAPLTDATTPAPRKLEPNLWLRAVRAIAPSSANSPSAPAQSTTETTTMDEQTDRAPSRMTGWALVALVILLALRR